MVEVRFRLRSFLVVTAALAAGACSHELDAPPALAEPDAAADLALADGAILYTHARAGDRSIHMANVDLCAPGIELVATGPGDGTRTVSSFAARTGALLAINGGHSWNGQPGPSAHDGAFFGLPDQGDLGQAIFGDGIARFVHMADSYLPGPDDSEVMTGLLTLVDNGVALHDQLPNDSYTCAVDHPRTLIGLTEDRRRLLLLVVDGRAPSQGRRGMTCGEAADLMVFLGAHWALNLDGGGSSEMIVDGDIVNVPSDGHERPVPTHLAVVRHPGVRGHCPEAPAAPPPPPPQQPQQPPPASPPASGPDNPPCGGLAPGAVLMPDEHVTSCDGRFLFIMQTDGNLVLYQSSNGAPLWSTRTQGAPGSAFALLEDGNMIVLGPGWTTRWRSNTAGHPGATFAMQDDGNAVLYAPGGAPLWQSGTCCR